MKQLLRRGWEDGSKTLDSVFCGFDATTMPAAYQELCINRARVLRLRQEWLIFSG
jgi:hypothetical protein